MTRHALRSALLALGLAASPLAAHPASAANTTGGVISGVVTAPGHAKNDRVQVRLYQVVCTSMGAARARALGDGSGYSCDGSEDSEPYASTYADASGRYRFTGLPTGSQSSSNFRLDFLDTHGEYAEQYSGGTIYAATTYTLARDTRVSVPKLVLTRAATIRGTVTEPSGKPVAHPQVSVSRLSATPATAAGRQSPPGMGWLSSWRPDSQRTTTDADGHFTISGLMPGTYQLAAGDGAHLQTWYPRSSAAEAATITARAGATTTLHHRLRLFAGATISGTVTTDGSTLDLTRTEVQLSRYDATTRTWTAVFADFSDIVKANGAFTTPLVPPGTYQVCLWWSDGQSPATTYSGCWTGTQDGGSAGSLTLTDGAALTGIDAQLDYDSPDPGV